MRTRLIALLTTLVLLLGCCPLALGEEIAYDRTLFTKDRVIDIDILMDDDAWSTMMENAVKEEYVQCNAVINGVLYENVGFRPKGNSSLVRVSASGSERFSFRLKFNKFEKGRTFDGLDTLILNNGYNDPGNIKEALAYDMFSYLGADASLYAYARLSHNGEYIGVYLALECVDKSFLRRNYSDDYGKLYKPDNSKLNEFDMNDGNMMERIASILGEDADMTALQSAMADAFAGSSGERGDGTESEDQGSSGASSGGSVANNDDFNASFGGSSGNSAGSMNMRDILKMAGGIFSAEEDQPLRLNYVGDDLNLYQDIWDAAKVKSDDEDHARVVTALENISERDDLETYMDVDNLLRYMAVQTFVLNWDGLSGLIPHNYYLYEENGQLNLLPWDYNEAFCTMFGADYFVNFPVDTPFMIDDPSQHQFFMALLENEEYLARYHEYLRILAEEYVQGGELDAVYDRIRGQIDTLVAEDPTAFADYKKFDGVAKAIKRLAELRAESVLGQLKGTIPATTAEQEAHPELLLDTSNEDFSVLNNLGFMMGGENVDFAIILENFDMDGFGASFGGSSGAPAEEDAP